MDGFLPPWLVQIKQIKEKDSGMKTWCLQNRFYCGFIWRRINFSFYFLLSFRKCIIWSCLLQHFGILNTPPSLFPVGGLSSNERASHRFSRGTVGFLVLALHTEAMDSPNCWYHRYWGPWSTISKFSKCSPFFKYVELLIKKNLEHISLPTQQIECTKG